MTDRDPTIDKTGQTADPDHAQPEAAEVESARLLGNETREALRREGLSDERIRQLADEYVALGLGEDPRDFVRWAREGEART